MQTTDPDLHLPFFNLESTFSNFRHVLQPTDNSISTSIEIPSGFAFDNTSQSIVYVSTRKFVHNIIKFCR